MQHPADRPLISAIDPLCGGWVTDCPHAVMGVQTHWLLGHNNLHPQGPLNVNPPPHPFNDGTEWEGIALMDGTRTNERGQWVGMVCACADKLVLRIAKSTKWYQFTKGQLIHLHKCGIAIVYNIRLQCVAS